MPVAPNKVKKSERGQSFIELSLVVIFLMIFVAGIVEFGFLLNDYLNMVDASREAVRFYSPLDPYDGGGGSINPNYYNEAFTLTEQVLAPMTLVGANGDDIVLTIFSVASGVYDRLPNANGWARYSNQVSKLSDAEVQSRLDASAPPTGVLLLEIFYHKPQVLRLPVFTEFVPDPMPVYVYAIMPLPALEPLPTPTP